MARATTKDDLIKNANDEFNKMFDLINRLDDKKQNINFDFDDEFLEKQKEAHWKRDKNLRDVLIHIYEWHKLLINWINSNKGGKEAPFLLEPYNWKTYGQMNIDFFEKHQNTSLEDAKSMLLKSHKQVINLIDTFSNEELFTKKYFKWTGTTSLGSYCISSTSSHYVWANKKIKKGLI